MQILMTSNVYAHGGLVHLSGDGFESGMNVTIDGQFIGEAEAYGPTSAVIRVPPMPIGMRMLVVAGRAGIAMARLRVEATASFPEFFSSFPRL